MTVSQSLKGTKGMTSKILRDFINTLAHHYNIVPNDNIKESPGTPGYGGNSILIYNDHAQNVSLTIIPMGNSPILQNNHDNLSNLTLHSLKDQNNTIEEKDGKKEEDSSANQQVTKHAVNKKRDDKIPIQFLSKVRAEWLTPTNKRVLPAEDKSAKKEETVTLNADSSLEQALLPSNRM